MNRLKKELKLRNITFEPNEYWVMQGAEYDNSASLFTITDSFIIILWTSSVLPNEFRIYDKNFNLIGGQEVFREPIFNNSNPFSSWSCYFKPIEQLDFDFN
jgi:hypothetical protein